LNAATVAEVFLASIGAGSGTEHVMGQFWRDAGFLRVERVPPRILASGKIVHLSA
jgi:hypothetical protein